MEKIKKTRLTCVFCVLILLDISYSFYQHMQAPMDGDMAGVILPSEAYSPLMNDPFGMELITSGQRHASPNRYFAHVTMMAYFKTVPFLLQAFMSPLDSIYLSCALAKTAIQVFLLFLFARFISEKRRYKSKEFILSLLLVVPLFQTAGYNSIMGIIDRSITYSFFYALPLGFLMTFLFPFYERYVLRVKKTWNLLLRIYLAMMVVYLSFHGPIIPGVVIIICCGTLAYYFISGIIRCDKKQTLRRIRSGFQNIPGEILAYFIPFIVLCIYSLYLGFFSTEVPVESIPLPDRYKVMITGLFKLFTQKLGLPILLSIIIINTIILRRLSPSNHYRRLKVLLSWFIVLGMIYLLSLPFGGYREYRPDIVRRDTILPIIISILLIYGYSSFLIIDTLQFRKKTLYYALLSGVLIFFTLNDHPDSTSNRCERNAILKIASSKDELVKLDEDCTVMAWRKITDYKESGVRGKLFIFWGITDEMKYYYQEEMQAGEH